MKLCSISCFRPFSYILLSYDTWKAKPDITLRQDLGQRVTPSQKHGPFIMAGIRLQPQSMDDSTIHLRNLDLSLKGREIFPRDNTHGKLLKTDHRTLRTTDFSSTYSAYIRWIFGGIWNQTRPFRSEALHYNNQVPHSPVYFAN